MVDKVPARYIGEHQVRLAGFGRPYFDGDGKPLKELLLNTGDTLMIHPEEAYGKTLYRALGSNQEPEFLGYGKVVKPEHVSIEDRDLIDLGYQFHGGRSDFEPLKSLKDEKVQPKKAAFPHPTKEQGAVQEGGLS